MNWLIYRSCWIAMRAFSMLWFRVRRVGYQNVPKAGAVLLVGNHASYLDPALLGSYIGREVHFMARSTLGSTGFSAWILGALNVLFVERGAPSRKSMQATIDVLADDGALVMFPEGTRSNDGAVGPFLRGFELVLRRSGGRASVVPIGLRGPFRAMPRGAKFPKPLKIELRFGEPIPAAEVLSEGGLEALRCRVAELADAPLATVQESSTLQEQAESESGGVSASSGHDSELVRRRSDGPTAASNH